jgi:transposase-like protein
MQRTPGKTAEERARHWTKIIEAARRNAAGVEAYCRENGINKNTYYRWYATLRETHPEWTNLSSMPQQGRKPRKQRETEVVEKASRRNFTASEKLRILKEVKGCSQSKVAAILRREGIYHSKLREWQREDELGSLEPKKRGPKTNPLRAEVRTLQAQLAKKEKQLKKANAIIEIQKKISELLGITTDETLND